MVFYLLFIEYTCIDLVSIIMSSFLIEISFTPSLLITTIIDKIIRRYNVNNLHPHLLLLLKLKVTNDYLPNKLIW